MITRGIILLCAVVALMLGGITYLVIWAALSGAVFLVWAAIHRGYYRSNR